MKFKDYFNSLVSKRKGSTASNKSHPKTINSKTHPESTLSADSQYDICGYEDINSTSTDDQHSRTQILLARHAQLVNTIVGTRSSHETIFPSCTQCRYSHQPSPMILPPPPSMPPPLPPKLSLEHQLSLANRNYSSTLATCSPRRECQHHQQQQLPYRPTHLISPQYSIPNSNVMSSSSSSLWMTTASLSKKQRSRIRTNPWIGNTSTNNRSSTYVESSNIHSYQTSPIVPLPQPEYGIYDPTYRTTLTGLIHSESFPQTISNGNLNFPPPPPQPPPPSQPAPAPTSSVLLHQSDSGHGFSLASSRVINSSPFSSACSPCSPSSSSSSSPPSSLSSRHNTSSDGILLNDKQHHRQKKLKKKVSSTSPPSSTQRNSDYHPNTEQYACSKTISSDSSSLTRRKTAEQISPSVSNQYRYQRPSSITKTNSLIKSSVDQITPEYHSHSSSSRSINDHFSLEFEEILENERSYHQRQDKVVSPPSVSPRKSPFILPLDDANMKLPSPPPRMFSPTLTKTNSRAILKHIEEIENEIRLIKNLDLAQGGDEEDDDDDDDDEYVLSPHAYPEEDFDFDDEINHHHPPLSKEEDDDEEIRDERQSIYEQVDQWVEKCLNTSQNPTSRLHTECDHLSNTMKDYVVCVCSSNDRTSSTASISQEKPSPLRTTFYVSSNPKSTAKRTSSFIGQPIKLSNTSMETSHLKPIHECPF